MRYLPPWCRATFASLRLPHTASPSHATTRIVLVRRHMSMSRRRLLPVADSPDRRRLGRGLESLLGDQAAAIVADETLRSLETDEVHPNPHQPRQRIDDDALNA